jgi:hypothetical protein
MGGSSPLFYLETKKKHLVQTVQFVIKWKTGLVNEMMEAEAQGLSWF